jgi:hypothetical protein
MAVGVLFIPRHALPREARVPVGHETDAFFGEGAIPVSVERAEAEDAAAAFEGLEEGGLFQAAHAPEVVVPDEVEEAVGGELEGGE